MHLQIQDIDFEGRGLAVVEGWTYAVRGAFPGDEVQVKVERIFKAHKLYVCRVKHFLKTGPYHIRRTCSHQRPCPACPLHGVQESLSLDLKRRRIVEALQTEKLDFPVESVIPHPDLFGYRQKVKLMAEGEPGKIKLGVYIPYSHVFSEAGACPHVNPKINQAIVDLMAVVNQERVSTLKAVILRAAENGVAAILITSKPLPEVIFEKSPLFSLTERIQTENTNSLLGGVLGRHAGATQIKSLEDGQLVDPDSFCQTDPMQANFMYDCVADFMWQGSGKYIDAYAGVGGFSKALLRKGSCEIIAVESNPISAQALTNLPVMVYACEIGKVISELEALKPIQGLILDPPKKGLMADAKALAGLKANRVALVSCDPGSMVRDLQIFVQAGYLVKRMIPIDFFGATPAIETVVLLNTL